LSSAIVLQSSAWCMMDDMIVPSSSKFFITFDFDAFQARIVMMLSRYVALLEIVRADARQIWYSNTHRSEDK
jgi:hypothetical protein